MKKYISLFPLAVFFLIGAMATVLAQEEPIEIVSEETITIADLGASEPRVLPTSPLYFFKELGRNLQRFVTFNSVSKAELELKFTNEKAAELKKISETQPDNTRAIQKAVENYQTTQEKLQKKLEGLSETSQSPKVDVLLDNLTNKVVKHEKLFDEIIFKFGKKEEISNAINNAKAGSENLMGEASQKDNPAKFASRLEKVLLEENGGDLKHARSVEIIDNFSAKAPEEVKEAFQRLREDFSEKLERDIQNLVDKEGENAVKEKILNTPGDFAARSVIIEEIQKRAEERLSEALKKAMGHLETVLRKETDIAQKAKEQIERAEKIIQEAEKIISQSASAKISAVVSTLLTEAKEHLNSAKDAIVQEKYGEAFGQARSAEVLVRNALKFFENDAPRTENLERQLKELEEKIHNYENLIKERGLTQEQTKNAYEILNNNAVSQLRDARESLAKGDVEKTKMYIDYIRKTFSKLSDILERKTTSAAAETEATKTPVETIPQPATPITVSCKDIQEKILELKNFLALGKMPESDFKAKYDAYLRDMIICQETKNSRTPVPATPTLIPTPVLPPTTISPTPVSIIIISPRNGENWQVGSFQKISWESSGIPSNHLIITVRLRDSAGTEYNLLTNTPNDGFEEIAVPASLSAGSYALEIKTIVGGRIILTKSAPFNIIVPAGSALRVVSPNGGEQWTIGNTYAIKWENQGNIKSVYVELYKGGVYLSGLGGLGLNWGAPTSWTWNTIDTPNFEPGSDFKIRVKSDSDPSIYDESDNYFSISAPTPSPASCDDLKSNSATNYYFESCKKGGYDRACFNKYYWNYQGCGRSVEYDGCTVSNMNADKNIWCDTGLVYACADSDKKDYYGRGTVTDAGKNYVDYCVDGSIVREYYCSFSDSHPTGIVAEENYGCAAGCENGACKKVEKTPAAVPEQIY